MAFANNNYLPFLLPLYRSKRSVLVGCLGSRGGGGAPQPYAGRFAVNPSFGVAPGGATRRG